MGIMHAAKISESPRLQRVQQLLSDGQWHGTLEIIQSASVCAVNSVIAELRAVPNELNIETRCVGRGRYEYRLLPEFGQLELAI